MGLTGKRMSRRAFVKAAALATGAAAVVTATGATADASGTDVLVHATTWGSDDFWKLYACSGANGSGTQLDGPRTFSYAQMQTYWDEGTGKYRVPLTVFANTTPSAIGSVKSQHINFTVGRSELTIEILD